MDSWEDKHFPAILFTFIFTMKKLLIFVFFLSDCDLFAQSDSIPIGRVFYRQEVTLPADEANNGPAVLLFNRFCSLYRSRATRDSSFSSAEYVSANSKGDQEGFPIYKWHRERKILSRIVCRQSIRNCIVSDTFGDIDWTLHPERRRFGQYEAYRATGDYRGRSYEVWYCPDIPVPSGPFKLGGLPGLIVEAVSTDSKVKFLFDRLEISNQVRDIVMRPPAGGKDLAMSYAEYIHQELIFNKNEEKKYKAKGFEILVQIMESIEVMPDEEK